MIMTLQDISKACKLSDSTVRRLVAAGEFPEPLEYPCRKAVWRADQVAEWVMERSPAHHEEEPTEWIKRMNILLSSLLNESSTSDPQQ